MDTKAKKKLPASKAVHKSITLPVLGRGETYKGMLGAGTP